MTKPLFKPILLVLIAFFITTSTCDLFSENLQNLTIEQIFQLWIDYYKPTYVNNSIQKAQRLFYFRLHYNQLKDCGSNPACGLNYFSDRSPLELPGKGKLSTENSNSQQVPRRASLTVSTQYPKDFDWRNYGAITAVKDQGNCGDCWAFSTASFFESELIRRKQADITVNLAEQFFLQCDPESTGCDGGFLQTAIDVGLKNGIPYQSQYPWSPNGRYPGICQANKNVVNIQDSVRVTYTYGLSDSQIIGHLLKRPLNIGVAARDWQKYAPQKARSFSCDPSLSNYQALDHTALLVGYTESEWIVKNQWGSHWGVDGYIYIARGDYQDCGIGWEIHTLNYTLDEIDTTKTPTVTTATSTQIKTDASTPARAEIPLAVLCPLDFCDSCYLGANQCLTCKKGYSLNIITKQCQQTKILNCLQFQKWAGFYQCTKCFQEYNLVSGSCAKQGFNPPLIQPNKVVIVDTFKNIPATFYTVQAKCNIPNCINCYSSGDFCFECTSKYAINQSSGVCQQSPIQNCNLFFVAKGKSTCFQCHNGFKLNSQRLCVKA